MKKLIRRLFSRSMRDGEPWAMLEVEKFEADGRIKMSFDYNDAFVAKIKSMGFEAETDEDCVQLFFVATALRPAVDGGDAPVQSSEHPTLSTNQNVLIQ